MDELKKINRKPKIILLKLTLILLVIVVAMATIAVVLFYLVIINSFRFGNFTIECSLLKMTFHHERGSKFTTFRSTPRYWGTLNSILKCCQAPFSNFYMQGIIGNERRCFWFRKGTTFGKKRLHDMWLTSLCCKWL